MPFGLFFRYPKPLEHSISSAFFVSVFSFSFSFSITALIFAGERVCFSGFGSSCVSSFMSILLMQYGHAGYVSTGLLDKTVSSMGWSKFFPHSSLGQVHDSCSDVSFFFDGVKLELASVVASAYVTNVSTQ